MHCARGQRVDARVFSIQRGPRSGGRVGIIGAGAVIRTMRNPISRLWLARLWLIGAIATGCGNADSGSGGDSSSSTGGSSTTAMTTAPTTSTTSTTESTTVSTTASTTDTTETTETSDASTSTSSGPGESSTGTATATEADGSGSSSGTDENGQGMCSQQQESCLEMQCCGNLDCCMGVPVPDGQAICYAQCPDSDRNIKRGFVAVDVDDVLARVATLPITTWSYIEDPQVRHIGPMAQDFKAAFAVGASDKAIAKVDADGVALAAVQALHHHVATLEAENEELRATMAALHERLDRIERGTR